MIFHIQGTVSRVLDRGFELQTTGGLTTVTTQTAGADLGLRPGDAVEVLGGPDGRAHFASSAAFKILPAGRRIEIPVNAWRPPPETPGPPPR
ncbi:MAG TPA: hypothetical protein VLT83_02735 [Opitutaceae bacterium]|nr:hypothetical protein [Opitutaceae bacterium]